MTWKRGVLLAAAIGMLLMALVPLLLPPPAALAEPDIFASPVHGGCYLARNDRCKMHVEPFTINIASGKKLVRFQLVAIRTSSGAQTTIYDFRPDQSNPVPSLGTTFTPSLVAKDFAASCGQTYEISLQGQDSGDSGLFNLGLTNPFTCPAGSYRLAMPGVRSR
jgi:hypothetical protein